MGTKIISFIFAYAWLSVFVPIVYSCEYTITLTDHKPNATLQSPGFEEGNNYPLDIHCRWSISTNVTKASISIKFLYFEIENHFQCAWDYVLIYDGNCGNGTGHSDRYCGKNKPNDFTSTEHVTCLEFVSDKYVRKPGFSAVVQIIQDQDVAPYVSNVTNSFIPSNTDWFLKQLTLSTSSVYMTLSPTPSLKNSLIPVQSSTFSNVLQAIQKTFNELPCLYVNHYLTTNQTFEMCNVSGEIFSGAEGYLTSPNYGSGKKYHYDINCTIRIISNEGTHFELTFIDFEVEFHPACKWDKLMLYDGSDTSHPVISTLCGNLQHNKVKSSGSAITIKFISDKYVVRRGFKVKYELIGASLSTNKVQSSTAYQMVIEPTPSLKSSQEISQLLEQSSHIGGYTFGTSSEITMETASLTKFTSDTIDLKPNIITTASVTGYTSDVIPIIVPDIVVPSPPGDSQMPAFLIGNAGLSAETYEMCNSSQTISSGNEGYVTSPGYHRGTKYGLNLICSLRIIAHWNQRIRITFISFDVELHHSCKYDNVSIYDGDGIMSKPMKTLCGYQLPHTLESGGSIIVIKFVSDYIVPRNGFKFKVQVINEKNPTLPMINRLKEDGEVIASSQISSEDKLSIDPFSTIIASTPPLNELTPLKQMTTTIAVDDTRLITHIIEPAMSTEFGNEDTDTSANEINYQTSILDLGGALWTPEISISGSETGKFKTFNVSTSTLSSVLFSNFSQSSQKASQTLYMCSDITLVQIDKKLEIFSPNYGPGKLYPLNKVCNLNLQSKSGKQLRIDIVDLELETHVNCKYDRLIIHDGNDVSSEIIGRLCGTIQNQTYVTSGAHAYLLFVSDFIVPKRGFYLTVKEETNDNSSANVSIGTIDSNMLLTKESIESINMSPGTQTHGIFQSTTLFTVSASKPKTEVTKSFTYHSLPASLHQEIQSSDIGVISSLTTRGTWRTANVTQLPPSQSSDHISIQSTMLLSTDRQLPISNTTLNRQVTESTPSTNKDLPLECNGVVKTYSSTSGTITSPGFDEGISYPRDAVCMWMILAKSKQYISLQFSSLNLEYEEACTWDKLVIYDGSSTDSAVIGTYCGNTLPDLITSTDGALLIRLKTDRMIEKRGFKANYTIKAKELPKCIIGQLPCNDGKCIQNEWKCDGENDCKDGDDEENCGVCSSNQLRCGNGDCIPNVLQCNGVNDCTDGLDEMNCLNIDDDNRLQIMYGHTWYPVCSDQWQDVLGSVICHHLLYGDIEETTTVPSNSLIFMTLKDTHDPNTSKDIHKKFYPASGCASLKEVHLKCKKKDCGERSLSLIQPYIIGGSRSYLGQWPWMVGIKIGKTFDCGGSLISDQWVVTASHCIEDVSASPHMVTVFVGSISIEPPPENQYRVTEIIIHPENFHIQNADIALMRLQKPIIKSDYVRPLCVHPTTLRISLDNSICYVAGWGVTKMSDYYTTVLPDYLSGVKMRLVPQSKCKLAYNNRLKDTMICAGYRYGQLDTCKGDSGGPLMCRTGSSKWMLVGITSWGETPCGQFEKPGVYTRVQSYYDWINEIVTQEDHSASCTFESYGLCGYHEVSNSSFMWTRRNGGWDRPANDHTFKSSKGHYMYAESSSDKGQNAVLKMPEITETNDHCLRFYFSFNGESDIELTIAGFNSSHKEFEQNLMKVAYVSGQWKAISVTLTPSIQIVKFIASLIGTRKCGVSIDDVKLETGKCTGNDIYRCNFDEKTTCKYTQNKDDHFKWELQSSDISGYHINFDGNGKNQGDKAKLISPTLNPGIPRCLEFSYRVCSKNSGKIVIHNAAEFGGHLIFTKQLWSSITKLSSGNDCFSWNIGNADLLAVPYPHKIVIEGIRGVESGSIEIDNLNIYNGNCL